MQDQKMCMKQMCTDWLGLDMCTDQGKGQKGRLVPAALALSAP